MANNAHIQTRSAKPAARPVPGSRAVRVLGVLAAVLIAAQIAIFLPLRLWSDNQFNFTASPGSAWWLFLATFLLMALVGAALIWAAPRRARPVLSAVALVAVIILFLQQNVLVWDYGLLDGSALDFASNMTGGLIDLGVWAGGLALAFFARNAVLRFGREILLFGLVMAGVNTLPSVMSAAGSKTPAYSVTEANKFGFSNTRNVLIINFDAYQSDIFHDIIDTEPELRELFDGFTFYADNAAVFSRTYPSIVAMLTGRRYQKDEPIVDFIQSAYDPSVLSALKEAGWNVEIYVNDAATVAMTDRIVDNVVGGVQYGDVIEGYFTALDLSLFRSSPHWLKPLFYAGGEFFTLPRMQDRLMTFEPERDNSVVTLPAPGDHAATRFLGQLDTHATADGDAPALRFYSLLIPHVPFTLNRDLQREDLGDGDSFEAYREYSRAAVRVMTEITDDLKRLGIYDDTAIFFVSDHGGGTLNRQQYDPDTRRFEETERFGYHRAPARALMLYKPVGATGPLSVSQSPTSLLDIAPTVAALAGVTASGADEGKPLGTLAGDAERSRPFAYYSFTGWDSRYLDDFKAYSINGPIRDLASWESLGVQSAEVKLTDKATYDLGSVVTYGSDVKGDTVYFNAFLDGDADARTTTKTYVATPEPLSLTVPLTRALDPRRAYRLDLSVASSNVDRRYALYLNDRLIRVLSPQGRMSNIPIYLRGSEIGKTDQLRMRLEKQSPSAPGDLRLASLTLSEAEATPLPDDLVLELGDVDAQADYGLYGFYWRSWWGRWTNMTEAGVVFAADPALCKTHDLVLEVGIMGEPLTYDDISVEVNGQSLSERARGAGSQAGRTAIRFDCGGALRDDFNAVTLRTPRLGNPPDGPNLGIQLHSISLQPR